jgi:ubiquinol-cytochrome c reductase cytochrome c1 subunit
MRQVPFGTIPLAFATLVLALLWAFGVLTAPGGLEEPAPPAREWRFEGPFGTVDRAAAQRGQQV